MQAGRKSAVHPGFPQLPRFSWRYPKRLQTGRIRPRRARRTRILGDFDGARARKFHSANASARSAMSSPSASDEVAAGEGALRTCSARVGLGEDEVVDERAVAADGLGAHAGRAALDVGGPQLGHVARAGGDEGPPAGRHAQLVEPGAPEAPRHPPGAGPGQRSAGRRAAPTGPSRTSPAMWRGEVHAEERQVGIGHRVDQRR